MSLPSVASIRRYPVKSMMGEELDACEVTKKGLLGDRAFGIVDTSTGKLANAKNPLKWPKMFQYSATFIEPPKLMSTIPPIRVRLPNGQTILSTNKEKDTILSESFNRSVKLSSPSTDDVHFEGYIPKEITELENPGSVFTRKSPDGTFFDIGMIHLVTTSTIQELQRLIPDSQVEARRFRPNLIIDVPNEEGFIENNWVGKTLHIGEHVQLKIVKRTKRCVMTTLAQGDLPRDPNVLRSIVKQNAGDIGVYASVIMSGEVKVDDPVVVV